MKRVIAVLSVVVLLGLTCGIYTACVTAQQETQDGILVHLSKGAENPHHVMMALAFAKRMGETVPVQLFCDIDAVTILTNDSEPVTYEGFEADSQALIADLAEMGIGIAACPMCMGVHGIAEEDLLDGVTVATGDVFHSFTDGRIVTLDW